MASIISGNRVGNGGATRISPLAFCLSEVAETPEQRLMAAILWDAINCYVRNVQAHDKKQRRLHCEAARWIGSVDPGWPFSFESICLALGLDADTIRRQLRTRCCVKDAGDGGTATAPGLARCAA